MATESKPAKSIASTLDLSLRWHRLAVFNVRKLEILGQ